MKYFRKLEGENVYLSPINVDDLEIYTKWLNNKEVTQYLTINNCLVSLENEKEILESLSKQEFCLAIIKSSSDTLIGNIGLSNINYKNGTATFGIFIGDSENMGKGYGSEAIKLLVNYAFKELRLHNIMLEVFDFNERAIKAYKKCGFSECGRRHQALYRNGEYHDIIYMEIVKSNDK